MKQNGRMKNDRLRNIWYHMKTRCYNQNCDGYHKYGARGIAVCEEWHDFENFKMWALSNGYADRLTLDRIDGNNGYCPENCRWATYKEQANNMRSNHYLNVFGMTKTVAQWADKKGVHQNVLYARLRAGWSDVEAVLIPYGRKRGRWAIPEIVQWYNAIIAKEGERDG